MNSARIFGALTYGAAAAAAGLGALVLGGDALEVRTVREVAPLAFVVGALSGLGVVSAWPRRLGGAMLTGAVTGLTAIVFFSAFYLVGEAMISAAMGQQTVQAVEGASQRLGARLPLGIPLAAGCFAVAGLLLWVLGALGRWVRSRGRLRKAQDA